MKGGWNSPEKWQFSIRNEGTVDSALHLATESRKHSGSSRLIRELGSYIGPACICKHTERNRAGPPKMPTESYGKQAGQGETKMGTQTPSQHGLLPKQHSRADEPNGPGIQAVTTSVPWEVIQEAERKTAAAISTRMRMAKTGTKSPGRGRKTSQQQHTH